MIKWGVCGGCSYSSVQNHEDMERGERCVEWCAQNPSTWKVEAENCSEFENIQGYTESTRSNRVWWHSPLIPALGRQSQADLCEFEASLVYSSRTAKASRETLSQKIKINK